MTHSTSDISSRADLDAGRAITTPPASREPSAPSVRSFEASASDARHADADVDRARIVLAELFGPVDARSFSVRFWDGSEDAPGSAAPDGNATPTATFRLTLHSPDALRQMLLPPSELRLGAAYVDGAFDLEGDLEHAAALAPMVRTRLAQPAVLARVTLALLALPRADVDRSRAARRDRSGAARLTTRHSVRRDAVAVRSHYDVGNDFYHLWLDPRMVYSCAYFPTGVETLDAAQEAKLEHICRKLRLSEGERLLDIGCGWGGLVMYAAARYGVEAVGVTLSPAQAALARERLRAHGLESLVRIEIRDYRDFVDEQHFDKIVSVGMVEHVGRAQLPAYFARAFALLRPGGLFLNHGIVEAECYQRRTWRDVIARKLWRQGTFIDRYVFPDGELVPVGTMITEAERAGFETRDAESLREHYVRTLRHWTARLESQWERAVTLVGPATARTWRLYMTASAQGFASARLNLMQLLLAKPDATGHVDIPATRADIYSALPGDDAPITLATPYSRYVQ